MAHEQHAVYWACLHSWSFSWDTYKGRVCLVFSGMGGVELWSAIVPCLHLQPPAYVTHHRQETHVSRYAKRAATAVVTAPSTFSQKWGPSLCELICIAKSPQPGQWGVCERRACICVPPWAILLALCSEVECDQDMFLYFCRWACTSVLLGCVWLLCSCQRAASLLGGPHPACPIPLQETGCPTAVWKYISVSVPLEAACFLVQVPQAPPPFSDCVSEVPGSTLSLAVFGVLQLVYNGFKNQAPHPGQPHAARPTAILLTSAGFGSSFQQCPSSHLSAHL